MSHINTIGRSLIVLQMLMTPHLGLSLDCHGKHSEGGVDAIAFVSRVDDGPEGPNDRHFDRCKYNRALVGILRTTAHEYLTMHASVSN